MISDINYDKPWAASSNVGWRYKEWSIAIERGSTNARMKLAVGRRSISGTHDFLLFVLVKSMFIIINGRVSNT
jgi:hypothetical protein